MLDKLPQQVSHLSGPTLVQSSRLGRSSWAQALLISEMMRPIAAAFIAASISAVIWANGTAGALLPLAVGLALVVICALAALGAHGMRGLAGRYSARQIGTEVFLRGLEPRARCRTHLHMGLIFFGAALLAIGVTLSFPGRLAAVPVLAALLTLILLRVAGAMGSRAQAGWIFDALVPHDVLLEATRSSGPLARLRTGWTSAGRLQALRSAAALDARVPGEVREIILAQYSPEAMFVPVKLQPRGVASEAILMLAGWRLVLPVCVMAGAVALLLVLLVPRDVLRLPAFDHLRVPLVTWSDDPPADPESPDDAAAQNAGGQSSDAARGAEGGIGSSDGEAPAEGRGGGSGDNDADKGEGRSNDNGAEGASAGAKGNSSDGQGSGEAAGEGAEDGRGPSGTGQGQGAANPQSAGESSGNQGDDGGDPGGSRGSDAAGPQDGKGSDAGAGEGDSGTSGTSPAGVQSDSGGSAESDAGASEKDPATGMPNGGDMNGAEGSAGEQGSGVSDEAKGNQGIGSGEAPAANQQGSSEPEPGAQADGGGGTPGSKEGEQLGSKGAGAGSSGGLEGGAGEQATGQQALQGDRGPESTGPIEGSQPDAAGSQQDGEGAAGAPQDLAGQDVQGNHPGEGAGFGQASGSTSAGPSSAMMADGADDTTDSVETITPVPLDKLPDGLPDDIEIVEGELPPDARTQEITTLVPSAGDTGTKIEDAPELRQAAEAPEGITSPDLKVGAASALFAERGEVPEAVEARLPSNHAEPAPAHIPSADARQILPAWIAEILK